MTVLVLLVEGDAAHAQALTESVASATSHDGSGPWRVVHASSSVAARHLLAAQSFDLALLCHPLPDGSCLELCPALDATPTLLCVDAANEWLAARAMRLGVADYLLRDAQGAHLADVRCRLDAVLTQARNATELRQSRERLALAIEGANIGLWDWDATTGRSIVNAQWASMLGYTPEEIPLERNAWMRLLHPDDEAAVRTATRNSFHRQLSTYEVEFRLRHKDGHWVWIQSRGKVVEEDADGKPLRVAGTQMDITARKLAQQESQRAHELLAQKTQTMSEMLNSVSQGISLVTPDNRMAAYNARYLELLDLPEWLVAPLPSVDKIVQYQKERGDFGETFELIEAGARNYVGEEYKGQTERSQTGWLTMPDVYLRKSKDGRVIEVRTRRLETGGRVRTFTDVTSYVESQAALRQSELRFRSLTELITDWYWEQDAEGRFTAFEASRQIGTVYDFSQMLGKTAQECRGVIAYRASEEQWRDWAALLAQRSEFRDFVFPVEVESLAGLRYFAVSGLPMFDESGAFAGYRGTGRDVTDRKQAEAEIERLAFYDALCNLPNRRLLVKRLSQALAASYRSGQHGALLFIDLDNFKDLNDTLGHAMGDSLLRLVAHRLVACVREGDTVARFGGDEFVVMIENLGPDVADATPQADSTARKILAELNHPYDLDGARHHSTPSIGITLFHGHEHGVDELLKRADMAMYQAKAAGRNVIRFFDPEMQAAVAARSLLEADLRHALERDELTLYYQPIVDLASRLTGVEALVRWPHARRGMVPPNEFIPIAERSGLILPLGHWVLRSVCRQLTLWADDPDTADLKIAVNVSARQLRQPDFVAQVLAVLQESGANPRRLKIELTESMLLTDIEDAIVKMGALQAQGVGFALDDFGTGYSSLSYLKRLPLEHLKIDKSFVRDVLTDPNDAAIARTVITLAHSMDLTVVAEGVETEGQKEFLARNGCREFQGYLFGRPAPVEALKLLARGPV